MKEFMVLESNCGFDQAALVDFEWRRYKQGHEKETIKFMTEEGWELQYFIGQGNPHLIFSREAK